MGRGRRRRSAETLIPAAGEDDPIHAAESAEAEGEEEDGKGFFACYLLCSLSPRHKGHTYIGFTVNPRRRIRQHNGEITCGAWRTKRKRPWEMILCIYGFPTNVNALQFEWAWQHPRESLAVRKAAESFKSLSGITNKIKIAYTMLTLPSWEKFNLTVNFFSTKYMKHTVGCPRLPKNMRVNVREMYDLPCYVDGETLEEDDENDYSEACDDEEDKSLGSRDAPMNQYVGDKELNERMVSEEPNGKQQSDGIVYRMDDFTQSPERTCNGYSWQLESGDAIQQVRSLDSCHLTPIKPVENLIQNPERTYNGYSWQIESSDVKTIGSCHSTPIKMVNGAGITGGVLSASNVLDSVHPNQLGATACSIEPSTPMSSGADINARKRDKCLSPDSDVIDLLTPSSCIAPNEDKRAAVRRQIIDLTESPSVIYL